jgi:acetyl-CoA synthetase
MSALLELRRYPEVVERFTWAALWDLFDGTPARLNLAHECVDRHAPDGIALRIQFADGRREEHRFGDLAAWSSRFARFLAGEGVEAGDRVAIMLPPSLPFYAALFGTVKRGAVAVPLFTLFGVDSVAPRVQDCRPRVLVVDADRARWASAFSGVRVIEGGPALLDRLARESDTYAPATAADDVAVLQYTSGTTRALPEAVPHTHRSVVTLMVGALYGVGLAAGDRFFCPSSPAWGHGLWHGTISPLALGIAAGAYSGRFDAARLLDGLRAFGVTNLAAAPTVYRLLLRSGGVGALRPRLAKLTFTGEPMDARTVRALTDATGVTPCGMYGTTEVGVIVVNYPGFAGYEVRPGALGKPAPGWEVAVVDEHDTPVPPHGTGEIAVRRKGRWFRVKDRGHVDEDGYLHHAGRSDDVIISAGWTMSAIEIEDVLLAHPDVREAAVVGVADEVRGQVAKAYVVAERHGPDFEEEIRQHVRTRLSQHEYPRLVEVVDTLPRTPAGKVNRAALREDAAREARAR